MIALLGGSFDPPHLGHQALVRDLFSRNVADKVVVLPSHQHPLKKTATPFLHRYEMAKLNFLQQKSGGNIEVSSFEEDEKNTTSYEFFLKVQKLVGHEDSVFVIGSDQFENLERWKNFPDVLKMSNWLVFLRRPQTLETVSATLSRFVSHQLLSVTGEKDVFKINGSSPTKTFRFFETTAAEISSTQIRESFAKLAAFDASTVLNPDVLEYIVRNKIYGTENYRHPSG